MCVCLVALVKKAIFHYRRFKLRSVKQKPNANTHASFIPHAFFVRRMKKSFTKMTHHRFFFPSFQPFFITDLVFVDAVVCSLHAPTPPSNTPQKRRKCNCNCRYFSFRRTGTHPPKFFFLHSVFLPYVPLWALCFNCKKEF